MDNPIARSSARSLVMNFWFLPQYRLLTKAITVLIAVTFILPFMTWAFETQAYALSNASILLDQKPVDIPKAFGTIQQAIQGQKRLVVHIQDLHCNQEVQNNIAQIIRHLAQNYQLRVVAVEGASQAINSTLLSTFPDARAKKEAGQYFMKLGKLSGAEYYSAVGEGPVQLDGVEDARLYAASRRVVMEFLNDESQGLLYDLREVITGLKLRFDSPQLLKFDHERQACRSGQIPVLKYCAFLAGTAQRFNVALDSYPAVKAYAVQGFRGGLAGEDPDELFRQADLLDRQLRESLYSRPAERVLDMSEHRLDILEKLLNISATPEELTEFRLDPGSFRTSEILNTLKSLDPASTEEIDTEVLKLDASLKQVQQFYALADQRSEAFVQNTLTRMDRAQTSVAVLITGGFHTEHVLRALQQRGVSCLTVKPRLAHEDLVNPYFSLLRNHRTPLEKLLAQNQNIFALPATFPQVADEQRDTVLSAEQMRQQPVDQQLFAHYLRLVLQQTSVLAEMERGPMEAARLQAAVEQALRAYPYGPQMQVRIEGIQVGQGGVAICSFGNLGISAIIRPAGDTLSNPAIEARIDTRLNGKPYEIVTMRQAALEPIRARVLAGGQAQVIGQPLFISVFAPAAAVAMNGMLVASPVLFQRIRLQINGFTQQLSGWGNDLGNLLTQGPLSGIARAMNLSQVQGAQRVQVAIITMLGTALAVAGLGFVIFGAMAWPLGISIASLGLLIALTPTDLFSRALLQDRFESVLRLMNANPVTRDVLFSAAVVLALVWTGSHYFAAEALPANAVRQAGMHWLQGVIAIFFAVRGKTRFGVNVMNFTEVPVEGEATRQFVKRRVRFELGYRGRNLKGELLEVEGKSYIQYGNRIVAFDQLGFDRRSLPLTRFLDRDTELLLGNPNLRDFLGVAQLSPQAVKTLLPREGQIITELSGMLRSDYSPEQVEAAHLYLARRDLDWVGEARAGRLNDEELTRYLDALMVIAGPRTRNYGLFKFSLQRLKVIMGITPGLPKTALSRPLLDRAKYLSVFCLKTKLGFPELLMNLLARDEVQSQIKTTPDNRITAVVVQERTLTAIKEQHFGIDAHFVETVDKADLEENYLEETLATQGRVREVGIGGEAARLQEDLNRRDKMTVSLFEIKPDQTEAFLRYLHERLGHYQEQGGSVQLPATGGHSFVNLVQLVGAQDPNTIFIGGLGTMDALETLLGPKQEVLLQDVSHTINKDRTFNQLETAMAGHGRLIVLVTGEGSILADMLDANAAWIHNQGDDLGNAFNSGAMALMLRTGETPYVGLVTPQEVKIALSLDEIKKKLAAGVAVKFNGQEVEQVDDRFIHFKGGSVSPFDWKSRHDQMNASVKACFALVEQSESNLSEAMTQYQNEVYDQVPGFNFEIAGAKDKVPLYRIEKKEGGALFNLGGDPVCIEQNLVAENITVNDKSGKPHEFPKQVYLALAFRDFNTNNFALDPLAVAANRDPEIKRLYHEFLVFAQQNPMPLAPVLEKRRQVEKRAAEIIRSIPAEEWRNRNLLLERLMMAVYPVPLEQKGKAGKEYLKLNMMAQNVAAFEAMLALTNTTVKDIRLEEIDQLFKETARWKRMTTRTEVKNELFERMGISFAKAPALEEVPRQKVVRVPENDFTQVKLLHHYRWMEDTMNQVVGGFFNVLADIQHQAAAGVWWVREARSLGVVGSRVELSFEALCQVVLDHGKNAPAPGLQAQLVHDQRIRLMNTVREWVYPENFEELGFWNQIAEAIGMERAKQAEPIAPEQMLAATYITTAVNGDVRKAWLGMTPEALSAQVASLLPRDPADLFFFNHLCQAANLALAQHKKSMTPEVLSDLARTATAIKGVDRERWMQWEMPVLASELTRQVRALGGALQVQPTGQPQYSSGVGFIQAFLLEWSVAFGLGSWVYFSMVDQSHGLLVVAPLIAAVLLLIIGGYSAAKMIATKRAFAQQAPDRGLIPGLRQYATFLPENEEWRDMVLDRVYNNTEIQIAEQASSLPVYFQYTTWAHVLLHRARFPEFLIYLLEPMVGLVLAAIMSRRLALARITFQNWRPEGTFAVAIAAAAKIARKAGRAVRVAMSFGTSGIRGLVTQMTDRECYINTRGYVDFLLASGEVQKGDPIVIAGDYRSSTDRIKRAVAKAIQNAGCQVVDAGKVPTPALALYAAEGGPKPMACIMVTGSHIPDDRNGIKFYKPGGEVLKSDEKGILDHVRKVREVLDDQGLVEVLRGEVPEGRLVPIQTFDKKDQLDPSLYPVLPPSIEAEVAERYIQRYVEFFKGKFDPAVFKDRPVIVDEHSAVGRDILLEVFKRLGVRTIGVNRVEGRFVPWDTENVSKATTRYHRRLAKQYHAFAIVTLDGDSDRPYVADEFGNFHRGDEIGAVVAKFLGAEFTAVPVSANDGVQQELTTSQIELVKTQIGSPYVIAAMNQALLAGKKVVVGWEVNGGFLVAKKLTVDGKDLTELATRDAFLPILTVLHEAAKVGSMKAVFDRLPKRFTQAGLLDNFPVSVAKKIVASMNPDDPEAVAKLVKDPKESGDQVPRIIQVELVDNQLYLTNAKGRRVKFDEHHELTKAFKRKVAELETKYFRKPFGFSKVQSINYQDGVRISFANQDIVHIRMSGNAPQLRVYTNADTQARADEIAARGLANNGFLRAMQRELLPALPKLRYFVILTGTAMASAAVLIGLLFSFTPLLLGIVIAGLVFATGALGYAAWQWVAQGGLDEIWMQITDLSRTPDLDWLPAGIAALIPWEALMQRQARRAYDLLQSGRELSVGDVAAELDIHSGEAFRVLECLASTHADALGLLGIDKKIGRGGETRYYKMKEPDMSKVYPVILAGGGGERVWPASDGKYPKQFQSFSKDGKTMLQKTIERLERMGIPKQNIRIATRAAFVQQVKESVGQDFPEENIIGEPAKKDTGAAIALNLVHLKPGSMALFLPADHVIAENEPADRRARSEELFKLAIHSAVKGVQNRERVVATIGIKPTKPATGYGYIHVGQRTNLGQERAFVKQGLGFVEKPDAARAEALVSGRQHLWNAGMFGMTREYGLELFHRNAPEIARAMVVIEQNLAIIAQDLAAPAAEEARRANIAAYQGIPPEAAVSVDFAVMEKLERELLTVEGRFPWFDEGDWSAMTERPDAAENQGIGQGTTRFIDASDNVAYADPETEVILKGVKGLVVAVNKGMTLVMPKSWSGRLKEMVKQLQSDPLTSPAVKGDPLPALTPEERADRTDPEGNVLRGRIVCLNAKGNIVHTPAGLTAVFGVDDLFITREGSQLVVRPKETADTSAAGVEASPVKESSRRGFEIAAFVSFLVLVATFAVSGWVRYQEVYQGLAGWGLIGIVLAALATGYYMYKAARIKQAFDQAKKYEGPDRGVILPLALHHKVFGSFGENLKRGVLDRVDEKGQVEIANEVRGLGKYLQYTTLAHIRIHQAAYFLPEAVVYLLEPLVGLGMMIYYELSPLNAALVMLGSAALLAVLPLVVFVGLTSVAGLVALSAGLFMVLLGLWREGDQHHATEVAVQENAGHLREPNGLIPLYLQQHLRHFEIKDAVKQLDQLAQTMTGNPKITYSDMGSQFRRQAVMTQWLLDQAAAYGLVMPNIVPMFGQILRDSATGKDRDYRTRKAIDLVHLMLVRGNFQALTLWSRLVWKSQLHQTGTDPSRLIYFAQLAERVQNLYRDLDVIEMERIVERDSQAGFEAQDLDLMTETQLFQWTDFWIKQRDDLLFKDQSIKVIFGRFLQNYLRSQLGHPLPANFGSMEYWEGVIERSQATTPRGPKAWDQVLASGQPVTELPESPASRYLLAGQVYLNTIFNAVNHPKNSEMVRQHPDDHLTTWASWASPSTAANLASRPAVAAPVRESSRVGFERAIGISTVVGLVLGIGSILNLYHGSYQVLSGYGLIGFGLAVMMLAYSSYKRTWIARAFALPMEPYNARPKRGLVFLLTLHHWSFTPAGTDLERGVLDGVTPNGEIAIAEQVKSMPIYLQYTTVAHAWMHQKYPFLPEAAVYVLEPMVGLGMMLKYEKQRPGRQTAMVLIGTVLLGLTVLASLGLLTAGAFLAATVIVGGVVFMLLERINYWLEHLQLQTYVTKRVRELEATRRFFNAPRDDGSDVYLDKATQGTSLFRIQAFRDIRHDLIKQAVLAVETLDEVQNVLNFDARVRSGFSATCARIVRRELLGLRLKAKDFVDLKLLNAVSDLLARRDYQTIMLWAEMVSRSEAFKPAGLYTEALPLLHYVQQARTIHSVFGRLDEIEIEAVQKSEALEGLSIIDLDQLSYDQQEALRKSWEQKLEEGLKPIEERQPGAIARSSVMKPEQAAQVIQAHLTALLAKKDATLPSQLAQLSYWRSFFQDQGMLHLFLAAQEYWDPFLRALNDPGLRAAGQPVPRALGEWFAEHNALDWRQTTLDTIRKILPPQAGTEPNAAQPSSGQGLRTGIKVAGILGSVLAVLTGLAFTQSPVSSLAMGGMWGTLAAAVWAAYFVVKTIAVNQAFMAEAQGERGRRHLIPALSLVEHAPGPALQAGMDQTLDLVHPDGRIEIADEVGHLRTYLQYTVFGHVWLHRTFPGMPEAGVYALEPLAGLVLMVLHEWPGPGRVVLGIGGSLVFIGTIVAAFTAATGLGAVLIGGGILFVVLAGILLEPLNQWLYAWIVRRTQTAYLGPASDPGWLANLYQPMEQGQVIRELQTLTRSLIPKGSVSFVGLSTAAKQAVLSLWLVRQAEVLKVADPETRTQVELVARFALQNPQDGVAQKVVSTLYGILVQRDYQTLGLFGGFLQQNPEDRQDIVAVLYFVQLAIQITSWFNLMHPDEMNAVAKIEAAQGFPVRDLDTLTPEVGQELEAFWKGKLPEVRKYYRPDDRSAVEQGEKALQAMQQHLRDLAKSRKFPPEIVSLSYWQTYFNGLGHPDWFWNGQIYLNHLTAILKPAELNLIALSRPAEVLKLLGDGPGDQGPSLLRMNSVREARRELQRRLVPVHAFRPGLGYGAAALSAIGSAAAGLVTLWQGSALFATAGAGEPVSLIVLTVLGLVATAWLAAGAVRFAAMGWAVQNALYQASLTPRERPLPFFRRITSATFWSFTREAIALSNGWRNTAAMEQLPSTVRQQVEYHEGFLNDLSGTLVLLPGVRSLRIVFGFEAPVEIGPVETAKVGAGIANESVLPQGVNEPYLGQRPWGMALLVLAAQALLFGTDLSLGVVDGVRIGQAAIFVLGIWAAFWGLVLISQENPVPLKLTAEQAQRLEALKPRLLLPDATEALKYEVRGIQFAPLSEHGGFWARFLKAEVWGAFKAGDPGKDTKEQRDPATIYVPQSLLIAMAEGMPASDGTLATRVAQTLWRLKGWLFEAIARQQSQNYFTASRSDGFKDALGLVAIRPDQTLPAEETQGLADLNGGQPTASAWLSRKVDRLGINATDLLGLVADYLAETNVLLGRVDPSLSEVQAGLKVQLEQGAAPSLATVRHVLEQYQGPQGSFGHLLASLAAEVGRQANRLEGNLAAALGSGLVAEAWLRGDHTATLGQAQRAMNVSKADGTKVWVMGIGGSAAESLAAIRKAQTDLAGKPEAAQLLLRLQMAEQVLTALQGEALGSLVQLADDRWANALRGELVQRAQQQSNAQVVVLGTDLTGENHGVTLGQVQGVMIDGVEIASPVVYEVVAKVRLQVADVRGALAKEVMAHQYQGQRETETVVPVGTTAGWMWRALALVLPTVVVHQQALQVDPAGYLQMISAGLGNNALNAWLRQDGRDGRDPSAVCRAFYWYAQNPRNAKAEREFVKALLRALKAQAGAEGFEASLVAFSELSRTMRSLSGVALGTWEQGVTAPVEGVYMPAVLLLRGAKGIQGAYMDLLGARAIRDENQMELQRRKLFRSSASAA